MKKFIRVGCATRMVLTGLGLLVSGAATAQAQDAPKIPAAVYAPVAAEAGTWTADITFYDEKDRPVAKHAKGVQVNVLLHNKHWITNDFSVSGTPYQGHGVWGYDPVAKTYIDTWVDTNDGSVRTDYGYWDVKKHTMFWSAKQPDGAGHFIDYRMVEEFNGAKRTLAIYQLGMEKTTMHPLVKFVFTRTAAN
ncbi:MAG: DUF1579 domain-containing protein [Candidatus Eremiobacteraeota bacterium]|nr:DUF1579 domain-containing protein [Candidatus Eremiobacteraeota bacterium]